MGLKHSYKSLKPDPADATVIGATKWNADHMYVDASGVPITASGAIIITGSAGVITHVDSAVGVLTSASVGAAPAWSTTLRLADGSASTPTYGFSSVSTTGIYRVGLGLMFEVASTFPLWLSASNANVMPSATTLGWAAGADPTVGPDTYFARPSAAVVSFSGSRLQFIGQSSAHPAIKASLSGVVGSGPALRARLADDSGDCEMGASLLSSTVGVVYLGTSGHFMRTGSGSPEGVFAGPIGSLYLNTNGSTPVLYIKQTGASGTTGWVSK